MNDQAGIGPKSAAIVCGHIARAEAAVCRAERDVPEDPADSGWQFLCGAEDENWADARVWSMEEVLCISPDLERFVDCPAGTVLVRSRAGEWMILQD